MRISDIIAYLGKDRQDAVRANILTDESCFHPCAIGERNAEIINNLMVNIIENSYGLPYIKMDEQHFRALAFAKKENYETIYQSPSVAETFEATVRPMMEELFEELLHHLEHGIKDSPIFTHHINIVNSAHYEREIPYEETDPCQIVADYIASMTDDYFVDLHRYLFPASPHEIHYKGYFD